MTAPHDESVVETLRRLRVVTPETTQLFAPRTRDDENVSVYEDTGSQVIFLDAGAPGEAVYRSGSYRNEPNSLLPDRNHDYEDLLDTTRRLERYHPYLVGKSICDFGCGAGSFLRRAQPFVRELVGVELQDDLRQRLNLDGVPCVDDLADLPQSLDTVFLFHSFEHLSQPRAVLDALKSRLKPGGAGRIVIEVPHARDFLIRQMQLQEFIDFTLWSQHLVLHTRQSLTAILRDAGFESVVVEGVQRYGIANHLHWLRHKAPGGHKTALAALESPALSGAYADALARLDATDTIVATAST